MKSGRRRPVVTANEVSWEMHVWKQATHHNGHSVVRNNAAECLLCYIRHKARAVVAYFAVNDAHCKRGL